LFNNYEKLEAIKDLKAQPRIVLAHLNALQIVMKKIMYNNTECASKLESPTKFNRPKAENNLTEKLKKN